MGEPWLNGPVQAAFAIEHAMGHVTHYANLRAAAAEQSSIVPTWLPIRFEVDGVSQFVPMFGTDWAFRAAWRTRRALDNALGAQRHDVVFIHTQMAALFSLHIMRRVPSIISLDATPINFDAVGLGYSHRAAGSGPLDRFKYLLNRRAFHLAALLVSFSEWARDSLVNDYGVRPEKIRVLASGAAARYFEIGERRTDRCGDPVRILFVGNGFQRKGGPELLQALRPLLATGTCELDIATADDVPADCTVRVHHGLTSNSPRLEELYERADVFVLPTLGDCLPVVVMEATAAGLPVVTTEVGALHEAVVDGESGILVPPGDVGALRLAIQTLVAQPELRRRMGRSGHVFARRKFDAHDNNQRLFDLLHAVGTASRARRLRPALA